MRSILVAPDRRLSPAIQRVGRRLDAGEAERSPRERRRRYEGGSVWTWTSRSRASARRRHVELDRLAGGEALPSSTRRSRKGGYTFRLIVSAELLSGRSRTGADRASRHAVGTAGGGDRTGALVPRGKLRRSSARKGCRFRRRTRRGAVRDRYGGARSSPRTACSRRSRRPCLCDWRSRGKLLLH